MNLPNLILHAYVLREIFNVFIFVLYCKQRHLLNPKRKQLLTDSVQQYLFYLFFVKQMLYKPFKLVL